MLSPSQSPPNSLETLPVELCERIALKLPLKTTSILNLVSKAVQDRFSVCSTLQFAERHLEVLTAKHRHMKIKQCNSLYVAAALNTCPRLIDAIPMECSCCITKPCKLHSQWMRLAMEIWVNHGGPSRSKFGLTRHQAIIASQTNMIHLFPVTDKALSQALKKAFRSLIFDVVNSGHEEALHVLFSCRLVSMLEWEDRRALLRSSADVGHLEIFKMVLNLANEKQSDHLESSRGRIEIDFTNNVGILDIIIGHPILLLQPSYFVAEACRKHQLEMIRELDERMALDTEALAREMARHDLNSELLLKSCIRPVWRVEYIKHILTSHGALLSPFWYKVAQDLYEVVSQDLTPDVKEYLDVAILVSNPTPDSVDSVDYKHAMRHVFARGDFEALESLMAREESLLLAIADLQLLKAASESDLDFVLRVFTTPHFRNRPFFDQFEAKALQLQSIPVSVSGMCSLFEIYSWVRDHVMPSEEPINKTSKILSIISDTHGNLLIDGMRKDAVVRLLKEVRPQERQDLFGLLAGQSPDSNNMSNILSVALMQQNSADLVHEILAHEDSKDWIIDEHLNLAKINQADASTYLILIQNFKGKHQVIRDILVHLLDRKDIDQADMARVGLDCVQRLSGRNLQKIWSFTTTMRHHGLIAEILRLALRNRQEDAVSRILASPKHKYVVDGDHLNIAVDTYAKSEIIKLISSVMKWSPLHLAAAVEKLFDRGDEETANFVVSRRHSPARCDLVFAVEIRDLEEVRIIVHGNTDDIALESVEEALLKCVNMKSHEILTLLLFTVANKLTDEKREEILGTKVNIPAPAVTGISFSFTPASAATSSFSFGATNAVTTTDKMPFKSVPTIPSSFSKPRPIPTRRVTSRALPSTSKVIKSFTASFAAGANDGSGNRHPLAPSFQLREVGLSFVESAASSSEFVPSFRVVEGETGLTVGGATPTSLSSKASTVASSTSVALNVSPSTVNESAAGRKRRR